MSLHIRIFRLLTILSCLSHLGFAIECPKNCKCAWILDSLEVDCSHQSLIEYPDFTDMPIDHLDLSHNYFVVFPQYLADMNSLIHLDLSNNQIEYISASDLLGFESLQTLLLANNSIASWQHINPNEAFKWAISLRRLSLSGNALGSFDDERALDMLNSNSLTHLELENCGISSVGGDMLINGLPSLQKLSLSQNTLSSMKSMPSHSLNVLELSNCNLKNVNAILMAGLPNLEVINLSYNGVLQLGVESPLASTSLRELDVSYCNLDSLDLSHLPSLAKIRARGNMLRALQSSTFANNSNLEYIDMSRNSLRVLELEALSNLKFLSKLDLAYNELSRLDRNVFRANDVLLAVDLSNNVLEKLAKLVSNSLKDINLSNCGLISIDIMALSGLSALQRLDLSNNLLREFPSGMRSETLQKLDLSNCKLSAIRNNTFKDFPEMASLRLNGNRFTNPLMIEYFRSNKYLDEIWIGDNPWVCNCHDEIMVDFYDYLTAVPPKLKDKSNVRCASPSSFYGKTWENACVHVWLPKSSAGNGQKAWTTIMWIILAMGLLILLIGCYQKLRARHKTRRDSQERSENMRDWEEMQRQNRRLLAEQGTPNAPNLYENSLPTYEDALRMPKPVRPVKSMLDLSSGTRSRKSKLERSYTEPNEEELDEEHDDFCDIMLDKRNRFRSEEMLSNRDKERTAQITAARRTGRIEHNNSGSRRFSIEDSRFPAAHLKSQNLQSAEHIGNFQSYENSPYTKRKPKIAEIPPFKRATLRQQSIEFLTDPEEFEDVPSKSGSPYAPRKPKSPMARVSPCKSFTTAVICHIENEKLLAPAIEDYFGSDSKQLSKSCNSSDSDFQVLPNPKKARTLNRQQNEYSASEDESEQANCENETKRKKRRNSVNRRASGNFTAAAAAAADNSSSSCSSLDKDAIVEVHKPMRETLF